jgi:hypothetical protein
MNQLIKYPRTHHIEGSKFQPGDEDLKNVSSDILLKKYLVIEEKVDGANCGISFSDGELMLQSRGHFLTGGYRERHFSMFKAWASSYKQELYDILENERYIMYGEWMYAKHTIYYDMLPSYFLEFDIYDTKTNTFLSTSERRRKLRNHYFIYSVPVVSMGHINCKLELYSMIKNSNFISDELRFDEMKNYCIKNNIYFNFSMKETDSTNLMEGLYIKLESNGIVTDRYKFIRKSFLTSVTDSKSHWIDRPIIPNKLKGL